MQQRGTSSRAQNKIRIHSETTSPHARQLSLFERAKAGKGEGGTVAGHHRVFVHEEPRRSRTARLFAPTYLLPLKLPGREKKRWAIMPACIECVKQIIGIRLGVAA